MRYTTVCVILGVTADLCMLAGILSRVRRTRRCPSPIACLIFFALGDIVRCSPFFPIWDTSSTELDYGSGTITTAPGCVMQGMFLWFGIESTNLWIMAFAHAVWAHSVTLKPHDPLQATGVERIFCRTRMQMVYHVLCWALPACAVTLLAALDQFGRRDPLSYCTLKSPEVATSCLVPVAFAVVFNSACLLHAQWHISRVRARTALLIDADSAARAQEGTRKIRLDFALYILVFLVSQTLAVVADFAGFVHLHLTWMYTPATTLTLLHGLLNAVVYAATLPFLRSAGGNKRAQNIGDPLELPSIQMGSGGMVSEKADGV